MIHQSHYHYHDIMYFNDVECQVKSKLKKDNEGLFDLEEYMECHSKEHNFMAKIIHFTGGGLI